MSYAWSGGLAAGRATRVFTGSDRMSEAVAQAVLRRNMAVVACCSHQQQDKVPDQAKAFGERAIYI